MPRLVKALAAALLLVGAVVLGGTGEARASEAGRYLAERLAFEVAGVGAWRASWADERNPGFHVAGGGGELNVGMEFDNGLGFLIGGRALFGRHVGNDPALDGLYADVSGHVIGQLRLSDWVRVGLGASAGRLWRCCAEPSPTTAAQLYGGFLRVGVDYLPRSTLPRALSLWLRIGLDGHVAEDSASLLPTLSLNLGVGLGLRL